MTCVKSDIQNCHW